MIKKIHMFYIICILSLSISFFCQTIGLFDFLENKIFDYRAQLAEPLLDYHSDIVLILIDEKSLNVMDSSLGRWPWPRHIFYDFLFFMKVLNAESVIFDIMFPESQKEYLHLYKKSAFSDDVILAKGSKEFNSTIHAFKGVVPVS